MFSNELKEKIEKANSKDKIDLDATFTPSELVVMWQDAREMHKEYYDDMLQTGDETKICDYKF